MEAAFPDRSLRIPSFWWGDGVSSGVTLIVGLGLQADLLNETQMPEAKRATQAMPPGVVAAVCPGGKWW